ncbi:cbb3-type cytochrome oxidase assembly protein CcoS [Luteimonas huabeiensis]|uniref:cbb3-type cytochrome oxidase assembly protein CcoS n=1 Tax=Luteimonas huabeiensis TaxID=1244513 RepID=UPI0004AC5EE4|nr:cbb3-type cytochrome oxidase assembly protein CcoS [Luteimonas huabeiensis]
MLLPISLLLLGVAIGAFVWAVRRGQFDDLDTPALDVLVDEDGPRAERAPKRTQAGPAPSADATSDASADADATADATATATASDAGGAPRDAG